MLYEMLFGPTPFESDQKKKTQLFIEKLEVNYPDKHDLSDETKQIIESLLEKDEKARLAHFPEGLSAHPWFLKPGEDLSLVQDLELGNINDLSCFYMEHTNLGEVS
jgi:serine/threonine protein kinase